MSERSNKLLIADIISSIHKIIRYTAGLDFNSFSNNEMAVDAVIRNFEVIGEAVSKLPKSFTAKYKHISLRLIKDFRNLLIHENNLHPLEKDLKKIYETLS